MGMGGADNIGGHQQNQMGGLGYGAGIQQQQQPMGGMGVQQPMGGYGNGGMMTLQQQQMSVNGSL